MLGTTALLAQAPEKFTYQAVVRNTDNQLVTNTQVGVQVLIMKDHPQGGDHVAYGEWHGTFTNANGLITLNIGEGNPFYGNFNQINWKSGVFFIDVGIDLNGGSDYTIWSTQQLLSVPFALYANEAGNSFSGDYNDLTNAPSIPIVPTNVSAFNNDAGYLTGYTETDPQFNAWDKDYNDLINKPVIPTVPTNVSAFNNDAGYLTGYTETDPQFNAWDKDYNDLTNLPQIPQIPADISAFNNDVPYLTAEQQILSISHDTIFLTGGSFVKLPAGFDGDYNSLTNTPSIPTVPTNVSAFNNDAGYLTGYTETDPQFNAWDKDYNDLTNLPQIPQIPADISAFNNDVPYLTAEQQILSISHDTIFLTGGSFVKLPAGFDGDYNSLTNTPDLNQLTDSVMNIILIMQQQWQQQQMQMQQQIDSLNEQVSQIPHTENTTWNTSVTNEMVCDSLVWHGETYTESGIYLHGWTDAEGINNMEALNLTVHHPVAEFVEVTACESYSWNGTTYEESGDFQQTFTAASGCDSVVTLHLTIYNGTRNVFAADTCESYVWNGQTYTESGTYTYAYTNAAGCASVDTLHLTIHHGTHNVDIATACESYTWHDSTYTQSGAYTYVYENEYGCASEDTLYLTVHYETHNVESLNSCGPYEWHSQTYTESGTYTYAYNNEDGCPSMDTLKVVVVLVDEKSCPLAPCVTDVDGNMYSTVQIGDQCWMRSNLRTTHYADGTAIPTEIEGSGTTPYYYDYYTSVYALENRGYLYNWPAIMHSQSSSNTNPSGVQGICPDGWHVPSDSEWIQLTDYVSSQSSFGCDGNNAKYAKSLAWQTDWKPYSGSTTCVVSIDLSLNNATGFSAVPAGHYYNRGYIGDRIYAEFWSSTETWKYALYDNSFAMDRAGAMKSYGFSVRCVLDAETHKVENVSTCSTYEWHGQTYAESGTYTHAYTNACGLASVDTLYLTVHNGTHLVEHEVTCDSYTWHGQTYTESGTYTYAYTNAGGCASVDSLKLTILQPVTTTTSATACESYPWNNAEYTQSGDYTQTLTAANGCDSVVTLQLTINHGTHNAFTETAEGSYTWHGQTYTQSGICTYAYLNDVGCPSVDTLKLTINQLANPFVCGTDKVIDHQNNEYNTVQIGEQCWMKENMRCTTSPTTGTLILETSASGTSYTGKKAYYVNGNPDNTLFYGLLYNWNAAVDTFNTAYGETSTNSNSSYAVSVFFSGHRRGICPEGWHVPSDAEWTQLTDYVNSQEQYRCNGTNGYIAKALASPTGWSVNSSSCGVGNSSTNNLTGFTAVPAGFYNGSFNHFGIGLNLCSATQHENTSTTAWRRYMFTQNNSAKVTRAYDLGKNQGLSVRCLRDTGSVINPPIDSTECIGTHNAEVDTACESYTWHGQTYTQSDTYMYAYTNADGCPSVDTLKLTVNQPVTELVEATACESYSWNNTEYTQSGDYTQTFTAANGCDSVVTLQLTINHGTHNAFTETAEGSYTWHAQTYSESGTYTYAYNNENNCPSTDTLHLTVTSNPPTPPTPPTPPSDTIADGYPCPNAHTATDHQGNVYNTVLIGSQCWTKENMRCTTSPITGSNLLTDFSSSASKAASWHPDNASHDPAYGLLYNWCAALDTFKTTGGVPEVANANSSTTLYCTISGHRRGICPQGWHVPNDAEWAQLMAYVYNNDYRCNDCSYLSLSADFTSCIAKALSDTTGWNTDDEECVVGNDLSTNNATGFSALPGGCYSSNSYRNYGQRAYFWSADVSYGYADYVYMSYNFDEMTRIDERMSAKFSVRCLKDVFDCGTHNVETAMDCESYTWHGQTYNATGTYTYEYTNERGCASVDTLKLTIQEDVYLETSVTACNEYISNGQTFTSSGSYTYDFTNEHGCPSTETLNLTIYNSEYPTFSVSECESYTWHGQTYTSSGTYTYAYTNAYGCPCTETLNLTIYEPETPSTSASACESYTWHGQTYNVSGTYTHEFSDVHGCTGTETLNLTIYNGTHTVISAGDCEYYTWHDNDYDQSGTYTYAYTDEHGCDCTDTLKLVIQEHVNITTSVEACEYYVWRDSTYTESGTHIANYLNNHGCLTTETLILTIHHGTHNSYTEEVCSFYVWHDSTITQSGNYTYPYLDEHGCASVDTLHLTIGSNSCPGMPTVTDHEGNVYNTVQMGSQCWTKENMRCTTSPSTGTNQIGWYLNNDPSTAATYGLLYNWDAAMAICPQGWHLPSVTEWTQMLNYVKSQSEYWCGNNSNYIAKALASETGWVTGAAAANVMQQIASSFLTGVLVEVYEELGYFDLEGACAVCNDPSSNNATCFSALPAGYYFGPKDWDPDGFMSNCWANFFSSTSTSDTMAYGVGIFFFSSIVATASTPKHYGNSVRCVRNEAILPDEQ